MEYLNAQTMRKISEANSPNNLENFWLVEAIMQAIQQRAYQGCYTAEYLVLDYLTSLTAEEVCDFFRTLNYKIYCTNTSLGRLKFYIEWK